jgi:alanine racemase
MYRQTWMEVNLDQITENVRKIKKICQKKIIAVVKADAYGCGDEQVLRACLEGGAEMAAVSSLDEAVMLRNTGYAGEILILGAVDPDDVPQLIALHISTAAYSMEWVKMVTAKGCRDLSVHLAVDTGMNRIGFKTKEELKEALDLLLGAGCCADGIFTHFYCADVPDHKLTNRQSERFEEAVKFLHYPFRWIHCDNSDAALFHHDDYSNACRIGITLYGITGYENNLEHPVSLYSSVSMCKHVSEGETIGYGATYTASGDEIILTAPIGYADGLIRANQGRKVYVDGCYGEIVGRVCMDQIMIRVDHEVPFGAVVEVFGPHISIESMAEDLHTIPYEVLCLISPRVTRQYIYQGRTMEKNERMISSSLGDNA